MSDGSIPGPVVRVGACGIGEEQADGGGASRTLYDIADIGFGLVGGSGPDSVRAHRQRVDVPLAIGRIGCAVGSELVGEMERRATARGETAPESEPEPAAVDLRSGCRFAACSCRRGYTYIAGSFPTRARARGCSLCDGLGHGGGPLGGLILPTIVAELSFFAGFAIIGATGLIAGLIALAGPAARNLSLGRISA